MVWTVIPDSDIDPDSPITTGLMTAYRDNFAAMAAGDAGAPVLANDYVTQAMIGASQVGQGELKTTTAAQSVAVGPSSTGLLAPTGGTYTLCPFYGGAGSHLELDVRPNNNTTGVDLAMYNINASLARTFYLYSRYIQASPPYNLGDGDIPLFAYALVENGTGKILGTSFAVDPHWAYHGRYNITPDRIDSVSNKKYKKVPQFIFNEFNMKSAIESGDAEKREAALDNLRSKEMIEIELTDAYKNQDMSNHPHPFMSNANLATSTVVLLDPLSSFVLDLYELHKQTQFDSENNSNLPDLLNNDYIRIDNTALDLVMPSGVIAVTPRWKNTI